jgi:hypothetical protein
MRIEPYYIALLTCQDSRFHTRIDTSITNYLFGTTYSDLRLFRASKGDSFSLFALSSRLESGQTW